MKHLLLIIFYFSFCSSCFSQDVKVEGYEPKGISTKPARYLINSNALSLKSITETRLLLKADPNIFLRSPEILQESSGYWRSEAVEVEIHGFDHEYFSVIILFYKKTYQVKFEWISDVRPDHQITIEPTYSLLKLSSDDFGKGKTFYGYLEYKGTCKGKDCEGTKFDIRGNFKFSIP